MQLKKMAVRGRKHLDSQILTRFTCCCSRPSIRPTSVCQWGENLTTGEGGMITTNDDALAEQSEVLRLHGIDGDAWKRYTTRGRWYYEVVANGYKYNLSDIQSAIGSGQMKRLDDLDFGRRQNAP